MRRWHLLVASSFAVVTSCATPPEDADEPVTVAALDEASYASLVHPVVERACGSTTCHGMAPRGLRVYGAGALRLPGETGPTTPAEVRATYVSIVGLEPEKTNAFVAAPRTAEEAYRLLVLAKPLGIERHRGGISLRKGEPAEQCLFSWLMGAPDPASCAR